MDDANKNNHRKKVSIITATYNSENFIEQTYNSLLQQTLTQWEWIITDDCSTDSTKNIIEQIKLKDNRVKVFYNSVNSGAAISRNKSLQYANGEFLAFIDSDDLWHESKLERQINFMGNNIDFSFTAFEIMNENLEPKNHYIDKKELRPLNYNDMLKKKATLGCSTVMIRRSTFPNLQMPLLRTGQDYATWLLILKTGTKAYLLPEVLTKYRIVSNSISRNKLKKALRQWQIYRRVEKINIFSSCYYFMHYAFKATFR